jgi:RHS repeat-associated protein
VCPSSNAWETLTDTYEYDPYGNLLNSTGTTPNVYMYRGEAYDSDLGLYYLRARYYNAPTGRFMSRDPNNPGPFDSRGNPIDPKKLHKYLYAGGDPVNAKDPTGRDDILEFAGEAAEKLDQYNKFAGPNDWAGCISSLINSLAKGVEDAVDAGLSDSATATKKLRVRDRPSLGRNQSLADTRPRNAVARMKGASASKWQLNRMQMRLRSLKTVA